MIIKYLTIRNFRGIDKLENLEISNLNTFVGKNDSGKSAILRALACFFDVKKFDTKDVFKGKQDDDITSIEISFKSSIVKYPFFWTLLSKRFEPVDVVG